MNPQDTQAMYDNLDALTEGTGLNVKTTKELLEKDGSYNPPLSFDEKLDEILEDFGVSCARQCVVTLEDANDAKQAIRAAIRTEKLKLLAEVRERVIGESEPEFNTPKPELGNMARNRLREAQTDLLTQMEAEL